ncbi:MAG TPA: hypothetical protein VF614_08390 [Chthoniobacteraceae bacterium]|jgi:hypothetical protein
MFTRNSHLIVSARDRCPKSFGLGAILTAVTWHFAAVTSHAAPVTTWENANNAGTNSGFNTASPVVGDGTTANSANDFAIRGIFGDVILAAVGDAVTLTGSATFAGIQGGQGDQFRIGLYDVNGSTSNAGWLGYYGSNFGSDGGITPRLRERNGDTNGNFFNGAGSSNLTDPTGSGSFVDGTYDFVFKLTLQVDSVLNVSYSIIDSATGGMSFSTMGNHNDDTASTLKFNRVGILAGGNLGAEQVSFSNMDVSFAAVPEPGAAVSLLGGFGMLLGCYRSRRLAVR